jgi:hypothetical protein
MNVLLSLEGRTIMTCDYVLLDSFAVNSGRKLLFSGIKFQEDVDLCDNIIDVSISVNVGSGNQKGIAEFKVHVYNFGKENLYEKTWWVYGELHNSPPEYEQGLVDIFHIWQKESLFNWFSLPVGSQMKRDYNYACLIYSGLSIRITQKEIYQIDVSLIREKLDFYYLVALEFLGGKGYFGYDLHTFKDCLSELYLNGGYQHGSTIDFVNYDEVLDKNILDFLLEIKNIFIGFKFIVR